MECNKEEAVRAKEIAEKKMQNKDFVGARKIALKAQQLFPDLENISQMLTICEVHCSSKHNMSGSEMDWYGILQVEQTADEISIKKQYRKLALLLHPDKNKFSGAEAAFKLIGEAQRVLSDQVKRSVYDIKRGAFLRTVALKHPPQQPNRNSYFREQSGVQNNFVNSTTPQFTCFNPHQQQQKQQQQAQPRFFNGRQTFWTACPFCNIRYQYYRDIVNRSLCCQSCKKSFIAHDLEAQGVPLGANWNRSAFPQQKEGASGATASEPFPKTESTSYVGRRSKTKEKEDGDVGMEVGKDSEKRPKFEAEKPKDGKPSGNTDRKRGRMSEVRSSDSCDTGTSSSTEKDGGLSAGQTTGFSGGRYPRRSTRQNQHVTCNEGLSGNNDFVSTPKRSRGSRSSNVTEEQSNEASLKGEVSKTEGLAGFAAVFEEDKEEEKQEGSSPPEESLPNGSDGAECRTNAKEAASVDGNKERYKVSENSNSNLGSVTKPDPEFFHCPDPDFNDFEKDRKEGHFAVDQIWAVYDDLDCMPRFYARIRKVFSPGFKLRITWLEADPDEQDELDWVDEDLPVACGNFKQGNSENTEDHLMFSHLIYWEKGTSRGSYTVYPRKGETWALFKNWNIRWSSDPDKHRLYEYEFVEVLSDYAKGSGISVAYLVKVKGFVSLFRQTIKNGTFSVQIPPNELFRFSHRIPSFRMTGTEREDVPEGAFEFDPASLPNDLEEFADEKNKPNTPNKSINPDEKNTRDRLNSKSGIQSPRESNGSHKEKSSQTNVGQCAVEEIGKHLDDVKDSSIDGSTSGEVNASTFKADAKERPLDAMETSPDSVIEDHCPSPASSEEDYEIPDPEFYNFDSDKSREKFQPGQIWALYCDLDGLPKYYAQIKDIESPPNFKLHITWLEACPLPKDIIQWFDKAMPICCGTFKLATGETKVYTKTNPFSHQLRAKPFSKNKYEIYPRKGEVWALYKNFSSKWRCSDLDKCDYDMVEVLEDNGSTTKVLVLAQVDGFKTVFRAQRKGGSAVTLEIPRVELLRFSHQVPAFRLMEERSGSLRGCWELDPASIPVLLFCSN